MPPKKGKGKKGRKSESSTTAVVGVPSIIMMEDDEDDNEDLDLLTDLNDDFFGHANKIIQHLAEHKRMFEATKMKKYVDIIYKLHYKYVEEVKDNEVMRPQISRAEEKIRYALDLTGTSERAMERLRTALWDAWRQSDASQLREQDIQEKLQEMMIKCESFESKQAAEQDDSAEFGHLAKYKNIILRERDRISGELIDLEKRLQVQRYYSESLEYINKNHEDTITKGTLKMNSLEREKQTLEVKIRTLMNNIEDQRDVNVKTQTKLEIANRDLSDVQFKLQKKSTAFDRQKMVLEKVRNDYLLSNRQLVKCEDEILELRRDQKEDEEVIRTMRLEDKVKSHTIVQISNKYKKVVQEQAAISSKLYKQNRANHILGEEITRLKNQMNSIEKDLYVAAHRADEERRLKDNLLRERENLRSDILKLNNVIADLRHTIVMHTINIDNLRLDISKLNVKLDESKIHIAKAEKERDSMAQEVESLYERIDYYQEQVQLKTDQITNLTDKLQAKQKALVNLRKQLETSHSEKMMLKRSLEGCTQERDEFRILQTKTNHQISQLTSEISANQDKINLLNLKIEHLNNEKKELQTELKSMEATLSSVRKDLREMKHKNESLMKTIADDEFKLMKISHDLEETRKEKNLIGLQMVRRNDEIVLLKDKLCIMQTALDHGQTQYNQRVGDIRLLKAEITNLQTERECLSRALKSTANMREEIIRLHRSLNQERIKVRALTDDAKTPTGVHRWRILKGEDPSKFQLLAKVQMMQRRNLRQEVEKTNLEQKLVEQRRFSESLSKVIESFPTTDVKERLVATQRVNRSQMKKIKALSAELAIDEIELKARECIIDEFKTTLKMKAQICLDSKTSSRTGVQMQGVFANEKYQDCAFSFSGDSSNAALPCKPSAPVHLTNLMKLVDKEISSKQGEPPVSPRPE